MKRRGLWVFVAVAILGAACLPEEDLNLKSPRRGTRSGGTLSVGISEPFSLDPAAAADPSGGMIVRTMCDPLISFDPVTGDPKPAIASSWVISDRGDHFTIKLRPGVKFHNGEELTSDDVIYSLSRVAAQETASPFAELLEPVTGYREVHGTEEVEEERFRTTLRGMRAIERYSLEIRLQRPFADFIRVLGHPLASPVPKQQAEEDPDGFGRKPVCAGPYRLTGAVREGRPILLERFKDYYGRNEAYTSGGKGYARRIQFRVMADRKGEFDEFREGTLDIAHLDRSQLAEASEMRDALVRTAGPRLDYIGFPTRVAPFDKPEVRVALSMAVDRRAIADHVFAGSAQPARSFIAPTANGEKQLHTCADNAPAQGDVERAKQLLVKSGADLSGTTVKFYFNDEFGNRQLVQHVADQWKAAFGLQSELTPMPWGPYLSAGVRQPGFDGPFRMSWSAEFPSADRYLNPLFSSSSIGRHSFSRFFSREFDALIDPAARRAEKPAERAKIYRRAEKVVCEQMPVVPVVFPSTQHMFAKETIGSAIGRYTDLTTAEPVLKELYVRRD